MSSSRNWPAIKTAHPVPRATRYRAVFAGSAIAVLFPLFAAIISGLLVRAFEELDQAYLTDFFGQLTALMALILFIGIIPSLFLVIPTAMIAIKTGYAGWVCAILSSAIHGFLFFTFLEVRPEGLPVGIGISVVFGALFWLAARFSTPAAFMAIDNPKGGV